MRLEVTRKSDLATRAVLALSSLGRRAKSMELAEIIGTSPGFLSQALTPLISKGWLRSDPGPTGGYSLATNLDDVSVLAIIEAVEGDTDSGKCVLEDRVCGESKPCVMHEAWSRARRQMLHDLDQIPLSKLSPEALSKAVESN